MAGQERRVLKLEYTFDQKEWHNSTSTSFYEDKLFIKAEVIASQGAKIFVKAHLPEKEMNLIGKVEDIVSDATFGDPGMYVLFGNLYEDEKREIEGYFNPWIIMDSPKKPKKEPEDEKPASKKVNELDDDISGFVDDAVAELGIGQKGMAKKTKDSLTLEGFDANYIKDNLVKIIIMSVILIGAVSFLIKLIFTFIGLF